MSASTEAIPLQPLIDATPAGQTLVLSGDRVYTGPAVISAAITISSDGEAVVKNDGNRPALTLAADRIVLQDIAVSDSQTDPKKPAILVQSDGNRLERLRIKSQGGGIFLRKANDNRILNSRIEGARPGDPDEPYSRRGNGIDLLASARNVIEGNSIVHVHDGVYAESSNETRMRGNVATDSRYGYHVMFSGNTELTDNVGEGNVTGGMVMSVEGAVVKRNRFEKQTENVNSQGILLFDVHRSEISGNRVVDNRVGLYIEQSTDNTLADNEVVQNFIGMQMIRSSDNRLLNSLFAANVNQAQSTDSHNNTLQGELLGRLRGARRGRRRLQRSELRDRSFFPSADRGYRRLSGIFPIARPAVSRADVPCRHGQLAQRSKPAA
ncbi:right-handed parallel beta-helix repeat-containing protein [Cohnella rhizosphaerae]|uniref:Right-handed parallel beta-helix repeat-containing protein n=1 Tax=Cohnella rhizosphaerae TaxID=1457232 RepID=A0A9X4KW87_9BACL|nr:NosD domain-containing protein [Cohnella rhizosphaerae]MDG0812359.1 right-handed parallel beta-helix repeat-containing protein [Cohnella rhizosphaerae]